MIPALLGGAVAGSVASIGGSIASRFSSKPEPTAGASFSSLLENTLKESNAAQNKADTDIKKLLAGETQDVHSVMLSMEQARLSMMTVIETRNKLVEAYQEVARMPV